MPKPALRLFAVVLVLCAAPICAVCAETAGKAPEAAPARSGPPAPQAEATAPAPPAQVTPPPVSPVTQTAVQAGVLTCASRINQVVTFLTANGKSHAFLFVPPKQPDQSLFSVSIRTEDLAGVRRYASASFAPTPGGQVAVYDTVEYIAQPPAEVEKNMFKNLKRRGELGKDTVILDGGPVTIFLMPAGSGSIVIKKEVVQ